VNELTKQTRACRAGRRREIRADVEALVADVETLRFDAFGERGRLVCLAFGVEALEQQHEIVVGPASTARYDSRNSRNGSGPFALRTR
jgi:hypothetical protein